ncbi:MAG: PilZ domain-containing protein [Myxococcaceae bacterium]|nr:PilZ domain-containing protein [Myxococcaceae bacterium]
MQPISLIPVPFSSLSRLVATTSWFCSRSASFLQPRAVKRRLYAGDVLRLALLAPEIRYPIDVNATIIARTIKPMVVQVRYTLADLQQMECALGTLYARSGPQLPVVLDVATAAPTPAGTRRLDGRRCRLSSISPEGATFYLQGEVTRCPHELPVKLQLPHQSGRAELVGKVLSVTARGGRSRLRVSFTNMAAASRQMLDDIVYRFRLGQAPWTPTLHAAGL